MCEPWSIEASGRFQRLALGPANRSCGWFTIVADLIILWSRGPSNVARQSGSAQARLARAVNLSRCGLLAERHSLCRLTEGNVALCGRQPALGAGDWPRVSLFGTGGGLCPMTAMGDGTLATKAQ